MKPHELDGELQAFAQLHEDVRVRKVWIAWAAAVELASERRGTLYDIEQLIAKYKEREARK